MDFTPYSEEWKKEISKLTKQQIIDLFSIVGTEHLSMKNAITDLKKQAEICDYKTIDQNHDLVMNDAYQKLINQI